MHNQTEPRKSSFMDSSSRILMVGLALFVMAVLAATLTARLTGYSMNSVPDAAVVDARAATSGSATLRLRGWSASLFAAAAVLGGV